MTHCHMTLRHLSYAQFTFFASEKDLIKQKKDCKRFTPLATRKDLNTHSFSSYLLAKKLKLQKRISSPQLAQKRSQS